MRKRRGEPGFTLIELLVVIIILGILAAVVVFAVSGVGDKGQSAADSIDERTLRTAEEAFCANKGRYGTEQELVDANLLSEKSSNNDIELGTGTGACGTDSANNKFRIGEAPTSVVNIAANQDQWIVSDGGSGPGYHSSAFVYPLNGNMGDPLVIIGSDYSLRPGLATSWELIPTSTTRSPLPAIRGYAGDRPYANATWRFHLRQGVKFHDGTDFDADDVIWSWRDRQPINGAPLTTVTNTLGYTHQLLSATTATNPLDPYDSVEKIDQYTVDFTPLVNNLRLPEQIGHPKGAIVPMTGTTTNGDIPGLSIPRTVGKHLDGSTGGLPGTGGPTNSTRVYNAASPPSPGFPAGATPIIPAGTPLVTGTPPLVTGEPVGTGPFKVVRYEPTDPQGGGKASLEAFDAHWGERAQVKTMNYEFLPDATQRTSGLLSGQFDMAIDLRALDTATVTGAGKTVVTAPFGQNLLIYVNKVVKDAPAAPNAATTPPGTPANHRFNLGTDPAVRRAVSLAIDRAGLVAASFAGNAAEGRWMAPPNILGPHQSLVTPMAFNPAAAATTLDNGGWTCGGGPPGGATACIAGEIRAYNGTNIAFDNDRGTSAMDTGRPLNLVLIGSPDTPQSVYDQLVDNMEAVGINLTAHRAQCNSAPCAGVARSQMYNSVMWDLDMELPNQNDANPAFLPVLRMSCLPSNAGFRFAPVDGKNGVSPPVADTAANGGGVFPFGNRPCDGNPPNSVSLPTLGPMDNVYVPASNNATTQDAAQNAAANQMRILVNQDQTNVVIPVLGQFRIYAMKAGMVLGDVHPSNTSQRWTSLTAP